MKAAVVVDAVYDSPVDRYEVRWRRKVLAVAILLPLLAVITGIGYRVLSDRPIDYPSDADHFKYGSIGSEPGGSLFGVVGGTLPPYPIFTVLPQICADALPGGYASLGFIYEAGRDLPIGISRRQRLGLDQVGLNCAACHTGTYRESPDAPAHIVLGMPAHGLDLQRFFRFVVDCATSDRFTVDTVMARISETDRQLGPLERLVYRYQVIPRVQRTAADLKARVGLLLGDAVPAWTPGRVDTFNPYKAVQFNWQLARLPHSELIGAADFPSLWNQQPREGMQLHWDGNNPSVDERNLSAALGAGVTPTTVDHRRLARVRRWIWTLPPPRYPFAIDATLAARGQALYARHCRGCHADHRFRDGVVEGDRVGRVVALAEIGTDPYRVNAYTDVFADNQYTLFSGSPYRFTKFRKTDGYANAPLDGIWARAPYLHNGSVPTLRDLLEVSRPRTFYRGSDVFDPRRVGFVSDSPRAGRRALTLYDTSLPGNGNGGHLYGTSLSDDDKAALVEYMKRL